MRRMHNTFKNRRLALGISSAIALSAACGAEASDKPLNLEIKRQEIGNALMELGEKAGVQIILPQDVGLSVNSRAVQGEHTLRSALDALLQDTGLRYEFVTEDSVMIKAADESGDDQAEGVDEEIVVTGSRLRNVDPASPVFTIDREEIDKRGYNSVEDILRALPQNFSGFNSSSHAEGTAPRNSDGASVADLRGLGFGATLILVNGRRTAASPAENFSFTDISTIPFGAIDRVEVLPDGGSAVYGADAVGGVINFILRKNYNGAETRIRYENSSADADEFTLDQLFGIGWDSGNFTGSLRYEKSDPSTASSLGITSLDHRSRGGTDYRNSQVNALRGTFSGSVTIPGAPPGTALGVLPAGDGVGLTVADLVYVTEADLESQSGTYDLARPVSTALSQAIAPKNKVISGSFSITQELTESIEGYFEGSYSKRETETRLSGYDVSGQNIPTSNIYNGFGQTVITSYDFSNEIAMGLMPAPINETEATRYGFNAGVEIELPFRDWRAKLDVGYSEDSTTGINRFVNFFGTDSDGDGAASFNAYQAALANDLNLFGDGTVQVSAETLSSFVYARDIGERTSDLTSLELSANGELFDLVGGSVTAAVGLEYRDEELDNSNYRPAPFSFDGLLGEGSNGPEFVPNRELNAAFFEVGIPVVGENNQLPGVRELSLTVQGRYENYAINGPFGPIGIDFTDFSFSFPDFSEVEYSKFSPKVGVSWYLTDDLKLRSTWSEGFQSPTLPELFTPVIPQPVFGFDPLTGANGFVVQFFGGESRLQPQESETLTVGFDYTPEMISGLKLSATWQRIEFNGQIGLPAFSLGALLFTNPELFPDIVSTTDLFADTLGTLTAINFTFDNIGDQETEIVDFDASYAFDSGIGAFTIGVVGTYTSDNTLQLFTDRRDQLAAEGVDVSVFTQELDNTNLGPARWKVNGYIDWSGGNWSANAFMRHTSDYNHFGRPGISSASSFLPPAVTPVASYTTVDAQVRYDMNDTGWTLALGATNLFDKDFPFVDVPLGADGSRVDFRRRVVYLSANKKFDF